MSKFACPPVKPFLAILRRHELDVVLDILATHGRTGCSLLEIGGGQGWQASDLAAAGFRVRSVDVEAHASKFPVEVYDGHHLPLEDASCDIVFSSNVLEHIPHVDDFQKEIHRVLRTGGLADTHHAHPDMANGDTAWPLSLAGPRRDLDRRRRWRFRYADRQSCGFATQWAAAAFAPPSCPPSRGDWERYFRALALPIATVD